MTHAIRFTLAAVGVYEACSRTRQLDPIARSIYDRVAEELDKKMRRLYGDDGGMVLVKDLNCLDLISPDILWSKDDAKAT